MLRSVGRRRVTLHNNEILHGIHPGKFRIVYHPNYLLDPQPLPQPAQSIAR
jgi:hypothetical protein